MRKLFVIIWIIVPIISFANRDDMIDKEETKVELNNIKQLNEKFKLEKFETKDEFEKVLVDKLYDKIIDSCYHHIPYYPYPYYLESWVRSNSVGSNSAWYTSARPTTLHIAWASGPVEKNATNSISTDDSLWKNSDNISYWETNLQKKNVDEPEILKLTKDYIAYFNKKDWKIYIIKSPVASWKIDLNAVKITDTITVPKLIERYSIKMFFVNNQLIVIWRRYSKAFYWYVTDLVFYKIIDWKAHFVRFYDVKWWFKEARIVNNKVYLITDYNFSNISNQICTNYIIRPLRDELKDLSEYYHKKIRNAYEEKSYDSVTKIRKEMEAKIKELYNKKSKESKSKILNALRRWLNQKSVDIYVDKTKKFTFRWKVFPIWVRTTNSALNNVLFVPIKFDNMNIYDIKFNLVNVVDIDTKQNPNQYIIFWNLQWWNIHMTTKSLYLVNRYHQSYDWRCPPYAMCILPYYPRWDFTLIHKLWINWFNLNYVNSQIVPWDPINQYSMDEDSYWNFRIFTKYYYPKKATDLYVFDKNLNLKWKIQGIAKWEEFKSSRFIWDKAYLVTFKSTDPLFVIDLKDLSNPKIIWELKISWYSLYLHPLERTWDVQYLLWIWQESEEVYWYWDRSLPKNIKIDVYKIDYSKKIWDEISVKQLYSYILWNEKEVENWGSYTPVFDNPRTFVYDKELKLLLLPVYLTEDKKYSRCYTKYIRDWWKKIKDWEKCNFYNKKVPYFIWVKWLKIDLKSWIKEILSKNYMELYKKVHKSNNQYNRIAQREYKEEWHRVSYYKNWSNFVWFLININFIDLFKWKKDKLIAFNKLFKTDKNSFDDNKKRIDPRCIYDTKKIIESAKSKEGNGLNNDIISCWKKWVLKNWKCEQMKVWPVYWDGIDDFPFICPWFDTETQCKEHCVK